MDRSRIRAPGDNGAILAVPALDTVGHVLAENRDLLDSWHYDFQGRDSGRLRAMTRAGVLAAANDYGIPRSSVLDPRSPALSPPAARRPPPLILSGHQPELFHPGVWVKNFAAHLLAQRHAGTAMHLIVDNDTVKGTTVRVPAGSAAAPTVMHLPLDRWHGEIPFEDYPVADESLFASFGDRLATAVAPMGIRPLAAEFWPLVIESGRETRRLGERIARARRRLEASWGCDSLELPVSGLCRTEGFYWFACHVLAQLRRFQGIYNQALDDYRRRYGIRSHNHPVPPLACDGDWLEAPFWVWSERSPRRRRLFARQQNRELQLTDRDGWTATLPLAPDREACCAVEALADLARQGVRVRTRALTTTLFTRLCLADLFIHGLGGAHYDEVSDAIIRQFFGLEPPKFLTLTATLHLPLVPHDASVERLHELERRLRDFAYNPERHLGHEIASDHSLAALLEDKGRAIRSQPASRADRRDRFAEIRRINGLLAQSVVRQQEATVQQLELARDELRSNAIIRRRDWAFCVYPEEVLRDFFQPFVERG